MIAYASLFSGIGGLDLGVELATGARCLWHAEPDPYCAAVLAKHWPGVRNIGDVRNVDDTLDAPTILAGGFPCQGTSQAGARAGLDDPRSGLWREYCRAIRVLRPDFVFVENVAGLLVRGMGDVLGDLAGCGYDAEWSCLQAADVGAPHLRRRVFILAACGPLSDAQRGVLRIIRQRHREQHREPGARLTGDAGPHLADTAGRQLEQSGPDGPRPEAGPAAAGHGCHMADAVGLRHTRQASEVGAQPRQPAAQPDGPSSGLADAEHPRLEVVGSCDDDDGRHAHRLDAHRRHAFPPGPDDREGWERWIRGNGPQPGVCRDAYGPNRGVDARRRRRRLVHLGNAACPQQSAAALVGLADRMLAWA